MTDIFEVCKSIPAYKVAQHEGLELHKHGERYWAACPFHADRTPSLCFFPDGGWKCFSCGAGGDAVALLAQLEGVPPLVAATQLAGGLRAHCAPYTQHSEAQKAREVECWRHEKRLDLQDIQADANEAMKRRIAALEGVPGYPDVLLNDEVFSTALSVYWWSENAIQLLDRLTPESLYKLEAIV